MPNDIATMAGYIQEASFEVLKVRESYQEIFDVLESRLIGKADPGVLSRTTSVALRGPRIDIQREGRILSCSATTGTGSYNTRITFHPKAAYGCSCPDWDQRRHVCKHVAALGEWCQGHMVNSIKSLDAALDRASKETRATYETLRDSIEISTPRP